ncbi:DUF2063 domain-containing protein [Litorivivens sp.]|uniref:HvfC family RiPP maturation protein n=1 Tax=Litorivivens sp. TaxID=2020868 RepID=UPI00356A10CF
MTTFQQLQGDLTRHIRDPERHAGPSGIEGRRLKIYRELFYNNIEGFLSSGFPVLRSIFSDEAWHAMVRDFMRSHLCRSPYFLEISEEFLAYLEHERGERPGDPPFMQELAHYEWVELALDVAPDDDLAACCDDVLAGLPAVSSLAWPLAYRFPVHQLGPAFQPDQPPIQPTYLVVYRTPDDDVEFMEINAVTFRLLALLQEGSASSGAEVLQQLAVEMSHPDPGQLLHFGADLMAQLQAASILR